MTLVLNPRGVDRLRRLQEDNMPYVTDIFSPPSTEAGSNGQPSEEDILFAKNEKCRISPLNKELVDMFIAAQFQTIPKVVVTFRYGIAIKDTYRLEVKNHPDFKKLKIISKTPIHQNSTAEIVFCSE